MFWQQIPFKIFLDIFKIVEVYNSMNIAKQLYWISKIRSKIMCYNILHQFVFELEISNCLPLPGHNITSVLNALQITLKL